MKFSTNIYRTYFLLVIDSMRTAVCWIPLGSWGLLCLLVNPALAMGQQMGHAEAIQGETSVSLNALEYWLHLL